MIFEFVRKSGADVESLFQDLAQLRIEVFRFFPYLYEGSLAYEKKYLQRYANSPRSLIFAIYKDNKMVGATSALPLHDEEEAFQRPFKENQYNINTIFYFGESLLLPAYRGKGFGHRFFDEREAHAKSFSEYKKASFCAVNRPLHHPHRPKDYQPLDEFWQKRGYQKHDELMVHYEWQDVGEPEQTTKTLTFWTKEL